MAYVPFSPQIGCVYALTGPNGAVAVFNDPTSLNHVGTLSEISGLDSADVREVGEDLVQADGGAHGTFYYGRRPITLSGSVHGHATMLERDTRLDRLRRASNAMRADAILTWQNIPTTSYPVMQTWVRRQQPLRLTGGWAKEFQLQVVSQYAPLFGQVLNSYGGATAVTVENKGDAPSYPILRITGPITDPVVTNTTTGRLWKFIPGGASAAGQYIDVDTLNHTATSDAGVSADWAIDFIGSTWPTVDMGLNAFTLSGTGTTTATRLDVTWRDSWI